jgi:hypothetical protein
MKKTLLLIMFVFLACAAIAQSGKSRPKEVHIAHSPRPSGPPILIISNIAFNDPTGNNNSVLDSGEEGTITFNVENTGKGVAYDLIIELRPVSHIEGLMVPDKERVPKLSPENSLLVTIPIKSTTELDNGKVEFDLLIKEANGFDADPVKLSISSQEFRTPIVSLADFKFSTEEGGTIRLGRTVFLMVAVQNKGQADAADVTVNFKTPENVFPAAQSEFFIESLKPNESRIITFEFFANKLYEKPEIQIETTISEKSGMYGENRTLFVSLDQQLTQVATVDINARPAPYVQIETISLLSAVDKDIPIGTRARPNTFALVIGNEDYKEYQEGLESDQNVLYAENDAAIFSQYLTRTLGIPAKQVFTVKNATKVQMTRQIDRIVELAKLTKDSELIFYYAGHGLPERETNEGYIIPVDVTASNVKDGLSLRDLYASLAMANTKKTLVILDACFSGGGRGENGLLSARTVKVKPKGPILDGNIIAYTATSGEEVSLPLTKESHGLFTYYLLKKLQETGGEISLLELKHYLESEVPKASLIENNIKQVPQVLTAPKIEKEWETWKF